MVIQKHPQAAVRYLQLPMQFCPGWHHLIQGSVSAWHSRSHHSIGLHSQDSYTLLFANYSRRSPELESFATGGCTGGPVSFPLMCQTCQISLPEHRSADEYSPCLTSGTTPGLLSALEKPASPSLGHQKREATALSRGGRSATMRGCALQAPSLEHRVPPCSLMPKQSAVKHSQVCSHGKQSLRNQSKSMPHSYHSAPQPWLAHFLLYVFTIEK